MASGLGRYFLHPRQLAEAVGRNELSEHDRFKLLFVGQIILFASSFGVRLSGGVLDSVAFAEISLLLLITGAGTTLAYRANGGNRGRGFVERFALLTVPLALKFGLLSWPVFFAIKAALTMLTLNMSEDTFLLTMRALEFSWNVTLTAMFFWRAEKWLRVAAETSP